MHLVVRESHSLDTIDTAADLGQTPADMVFLSFADTDLGAAAVAWQAGRDRLPTLRLANLGKLRHPMSADLYIDDVVSKARVVVARLLGGLEYWRYGAEELARVARDNGIALALLPGDGRDDPRLVELSTVDADAHGRLDAYFREGGPENAGAALALMAHVAGRGADPAIPVRMLPGHGRYDFGHARDGERPLAVIMFYRAYLLAGDMAPVEALAAALNEAGIDSVGLFAASLKEPEGAAFVAQALRELRPAVILNATAFSARRDDGPSPLDAAGVPVLQATLAGSSREAWDGSSRGLSQSDLAMQIVLPELDGRLSTTAISFKDEGSPDPSLEFAWARHAPEPAGIALAVKQATGWARLGARDRADRRLGLILSDYPAAGQSAHAIGLDTIASCVETLGMLGEAGYRTGPSSVTASDLVASLCDAAPDAILSLETYARLFAALPAAARSRIRSTWGRPEDDPAMVDGAFAIRHARFGNIVAAIQPDRGHAADRKAVYHDPDVPPRHAYVAFYLWLRAVEDIDAIVHMGAHGTLEWLPGKAVAVSEACFPPVLLDGLPVVYPFIVNNPGEAAAAKRRLGAVTIGHLTPPLKSAGTHGAATELERLIDEFAAADGLDRRRTALLRDEILDRADALGLMEECGASPDLSEDDALARLDAYLCDVKDLQIRDGLHVFGAPPAADRREALIAGLTKSNAGLEADALADRLDGCARAEREALLAALDGRFVAPGPSGAPTRGRADVLPTGRNLFTIDPRGVPTRSAMVLAEKAASELMRRHLQEHGEWPRALLIDLWGSATMRTGGEDLALALVLVGAQPVWHEGSNRVTGFEIVPVQQLEWPRVDVTLRISGLFRDAFEAQIAMFDAVVRAVAERAEPKDYNPLASAVCGLEGDALRRATTRIYGAAPGAYGAGVSSLVETGDWQDRSELGESYLAASGNAYGADLDGQADADGFVERVRRSDALVHAQDHREVDLLDSMDFAAHEGGFVAAADTLGRAPSVYHMDTSKPESPRARTLAEEIAQTVRGRAANPQWIAGMMRHGYRGGAEIARSLEGLFGFAATLPGRLDRQFDLVFDATLGDPDVDAFLLAENPQARGAMVARFNEAIERELWKPRRNSVAAVLTGDRA